MNTSARLLNGTDAFFYANKYSADFLLYFHRSACSMALLVGVIWPTAASINIQRLNLPSHFVRDTREL